MSESGCRHWYHESVDNVEHCKDCNVILDVQPFWEGKITIGKLENLYEIEGVDFDFKELIEDQVGTGIEIDTVRIVNGANYWDRPFLVVFTVGRARLTANIAASKSNHYIPTDQIYTPVVEEV